MKTWVLMLFLGVTTPIQIEGYTSKAECDEAGRCAVTHMGNCKLEHRKCHWECIPGPSGPLSTLPKFR